MFLNVRDHVKAWCFWLQLAMVVPLSMDLPPQGNRKKPVVLQEGDPEFRGSLEHLG